MIYTKKQINTMLQRLEASLGLVFVQIGADMGSLANRIAKLEESNKCVTKCSKPKKSKLVKNKKK